MMKMKRTMAKTVVESIIFMGGQMLARLVIH